MKIAFCISKDNKNIKTTISNIFLTVKFRDNVTVVRRTIGKTTSHPVETLVEVNESEQ